MPIVINPWLAVVLSVIFIAAAAAILPGCGVIEKGDASQFWGPRERWSH